MAARWQAARTATVALALVATAVGATGVAGAGEDVAPSHRVVDAKTAASIDAQTLAKQRGWEVAATAQHFQDSRRFAELARALGDKYPEIWAGARFSAAPGGASLVRFVGEPPSEVHREVEESRLKVEVQGGAKRSEREVQERAEKVHQHLLETGYKQVATATSPEGTIQATVFGEGRSELPQELAEGVRVSVSKEPVARDEHSLGGAPLLVNGVFNCTSGFTVQNGAGVTGLATAGHCTGLNQYRQPSDGLVYGMTHQAEHNGFWGDFEWKTTPHVEPAEFFARSAEVRPVTSVSGWLPVGTPSCVYGRSSNLRACDTVYSSFVIVTLNGATNWFLMAMQSDNTIPGDSGGPWSFATIADGIHKGDVTLGGGRRNMWSRASLLPAALGVSVRTQ